MQAIKIIFFILFVIFLTNCSSRDKKLEADKMTMGAKPYLEGIVAQIPRRWFDTAQRFKLVDANNQKAKHLFWDVAPDINYANQTLNFVITTVANSDFNYELDLASGQRFASQKFCNQSDIWKNYEEFVNKPFFSIGIIPRVLDQQMRPQQILVFGDDQYYKNKYEDNYFDARVIGSFVLQDCPKGACLEQDSWNSRMVLVGVQKDNEEYKEVKTIVDLQKKIDWRGVKAFMENAFGRNTVANNVYPAFKMGPSISAGQAMYFLEKKSKHFSIKDIKNLKISCYRLYDYLWKNLSFDAAKLKDKSKVQNSKIARFSKKEEKNKVDMELVTRPFYKRFIMDFKKYNKDFNTCSKFVYNSSVNYKQERFNFFTYFDALLKTYSLGNYFSCERKVWLENPLVDVGKRSVALDKMFKGCDDRDIDIAFESSVDYLFSLNQSNRASFRYIDYDKGVFGTHNKLYSWVKTSGRVLACQDDKDESFSKLAAIFPNDIEWKKREKRVKYDKKLGKIIE